MVRGHSKHGEKSYHLTTTKTPQGKMSYGRIKFDDCVHHYCLYDGTKGFMTEIFDLDGKFLGNGDMFDLSPHNPNSRTGRMTKGEAIKTAKAMVETHLDDEFPLWTPSGWTLDPSDYFDNEGHPTRKQKGSE